MKNNISIRQFILILILLISVFFIANNNPFILKMKQITKAPILDMMINYSPGQAYSYLNELGDMGRKTYIEFLLIIDILFPIAYSVLTFLMLSFFLQRIIQKNNIINFIKYIPFIVGILDITENFLEIILLLNYPREIMEIVKIASAITTVKMILACFIIIILLIIIIVFIYQIFQKFIIKKKIK